MRRIATAVVVLVAAVSLVASALAATKPRLAGPVRPGFTISLEQGAKKATSVRPGAYAVVIDDPSSAHNFHLTGPGVNKTTGVGFTGNVTWKVTLKKGTYKFICDPHAAIMKGSFKVS